MSFHLPTSCVPYRIAELFCCAKYHVGNEFYIVHGSGKNMIITSTGLPMSNFLPLALGSTG
jgi:hypothetical protein